MPLSSQQLRVDQAGHEDAVRPRLRATAFDRREPVTRRAAALETLFRADWERSAPRWHRNLALTAEKVTSAPALWSSTFWRRSWPRRSLSWLLGTPEATAIRQVTELAPADGQPQPDGMLREALVRAC